MMTNLIDIVYYEHQYLFNRGDYTFVRHASKFYCVLGLAEFVERIQKVCWVTNNNNVV